MTIGVPDGTHSLRISQIKIIQFKGKNMKKLVQISLILVLLVALFQATAGRQTVLAGQMGANSTSAQGTRVVTCPGLKSVVCTVPNVGWNS